MASYFQDGDTIDYTPSAAVAAGDVVVIGDTVTVAPHAIAANKLGAVAPVGVFQMPKGTGAIGQLVVVYWDATNSVVTTTASTNKRVGRTALAALSADTTVPVMLNIG